MTRLAILPGRISRGLADAEREGRDAAIGLMLDRIESAQITAEAALMDEADDHGQDLVAR